MGTQQPTISVADWTDANFLNYSREHVLYEVAMLFATADILDQWSPAFSEPLRMATIESFAMHARNLIDFFYLNDRSSTDVVAARFYSDSKLPAGFQEISEELKQAKNRANKEVGHLTTSRIGGSPPEKAWPVNQVCEELRLLLKRFIESASPSRLHEDLRQCVNALPRCDVLPRYGKVPDSRNTTSTTSSFATFLRSDTFRRSE